MDDKRLTGIADTDTLRFCVHDNVYRHIKISGLIHKNMAVSGSGFDHRDRRLIHDRTDQSCPTTWDQHIDILVHFHKCRSGISRRIFDQRCRFFWNAKLF